jgi:hypothetical protein
MTLKASRDLTLQGQNVSIKGQIKTNIEAGTEATLKGNVSATVNGGASATLQAGIVSIKGITSFSP